MALAPGVRLGPYAITAQIGVGGMGEVYRARDTKLDGDVAIKVLPRPYSCTNASVLTNSQTNAAGTWSAARIRVMRRDQ